MVGKQRLLGRKHFSTLLDSFTGDLQIELTKGRLTRERAYTFILCALECTEKSNSNKWLVLRVYTPFFTKVWVSKVDKL